jgi:hypothetical protein
MMSTAAEELLAQIRPHPLAPPTPGHGMMNALMLGYHALDHPPPRRAGCRGCTTTYGPSAWKSLY